MNIEAVLILFILLVILLLSWEYSMHSLKVEEPHPYTGQQKLHPFPYSMGYPPFEFW